MHALSQQLRGFVCGLGVPYKCESSVKIYAGHFSEERFLLSVSRSCLTPGCRKKILAWLLDRHFPEAGRVWFERSWGQAQFLHFGYEQLGRTVMLKVYFEYAKSFYHYLQDPTKGSTLVFDALKWSQRGESVLTQYRHKTFSTESCLWQQLGTAEEALKPLLQRVFTAVPLEDSYVLEVTEPDNPRASLDINCYDARLTVSQLSTELLAACLFKGATQSRIELLLSKQSNRFLGHVSTGMSRSGQDFMTLYFSV